MWHNQCFRRVLFIALMPFLGGVASAGTLADLHLETASRSPAELALIANLTTPTGDFSTAEPAEHRPGGDGTFQGGADENAFSQPSTNLSFEQTLDFRDGNRLFRKEWLAARDSDTEFDGLGPLYNAVSCQSCHVRDGRGRPPVSPQDDTVSMFLRVSVPGGKDIAAIRDYIATSDEPTYGKQMQNVAVSGHAGEGKLEIHYQEHEIKLSQGEVAHLRRPSYQIGTIGYGPMQQDAMLSPRVAPQMIGLGLLEAIPTEDILAGVDEDDANGDGISGRANIVWSVEFDQPMLGRFGLKAGTPTIYQQSGDAFAIDMGISNPVAPEPWGDCTPAQVECRAARHGGDVMNGLEVSATGLNQVAFYSRNLAVPERQGVGDTQVLRGKEVFYTTGCISCHTPKFVTHNMSSRTEHSSQLIWPYTDLLLHDMGEGLADHRPESRATGREWRTPPLWGIGRTKVVSGHTLFLHDGRARSLLEAILWHGGEAEAVKQAVVAMPKADRAALIRFLENL